MGTFEGKRAIQAFAARDEGVRAGLTRLRRGHTRQRTEIAGSARSAGVPWPANASPCIRRLAHRGRRVRGQPRVTARLTVGLRFLGAWYLPFPAAIVAARSLVVATAGHRLVGDRAGAIYDDRKGAAGVGVQSGIALGTAGTLGFQVSATGACVSKAEHITEGACAALGPGESGRRSGQHQ